MVRWWFSANPQWKEWERARRMWSAKVAIHNRHFRTVHMSLFPILFSSAFLFPFKEHKHNMLFISMCCGWVCVRVCVFFCVASLCQPQTTRNPTAYTYHTHTFKIGFEMSFCGYATTNTQAWRMKWRGWSGMRKDETSWRMNERSYRPYTYLCRIKNGAHVLEKMILSYDEWWCSFLLSFGSPHSFTSSSECITKCCQIMKLSTCTPCTVQSDSTQPPMGADQTCIHKQIAWFDDKETKMAILKKKKEKGKESAKKHVSWKSPGCVCVLVWWTKEWEKVDSLFYTHTHEKPTNRRWTIRVWLERFHSIPKTRKFVVAYFCRLNFSTYVCNIYFFPIFSVRVFFHAVPFWFLFVRFFFTFIHFARSLRRIRLPIAYLFLCL